MVSSLTPQELSEKQKRQAGRVRGMLVFMGMLVVIMFGLTLEHL